MQYINQGAMFLSVQMHQPERTSHAYMDALQAFWPGLQVSITRSFEVPFSIHSGIALEAINWQTSLSTTDV